MISLCEKKLFCIKLWIMFHELACSPRRIYQNSATEVKYIFLGLEAKHEKLSNLMNAFEIYFKIRSIFSVEFRPFKKRWQSKLSKVPEIS